jgi:hypothetical protein
MVNNLAPVGSKHLKTVIKASFFLRNCSWKRSVVVVLKRAAGGSIAAIGNDPDHPSSKLREGCALTPAYSAILALFFFTFFHFRTWLLDFVGFGRFWALF